MGWVPVSHILFPRSLWVLVAQRLVRSQAPGLNNVGLYPPCVSLGKPLNLSEPDVSICTVWISREEDTTRCVANAAPGPLPVFRAHQLLLEAAALFSLLDHLCCLSLIPRLFPGLLLGTSPRGSDLLHAQDHLLACSAHSQGAAERCSGGSCAPHHPQTGGPTGPRVSPSEPLKPPGREGLPCAPPGHRGRRPEEQWTVEGRLQCWTAGSQARGWGRDGGGVGGVGARPPKASKNYERAGSHCRPPQGLQVLGGEGLLPRCLD